MQPLASFSYPFGHCSAQPIAGQAVPPPPEPEPPVGGGTGGGVQPPPPVPGSPQLHWQGGQGAPGGHDGQAQPHPPDGGGDWQTPDLQFGSPAAHGTPSAYHMHVKPVGSGVTQLFSSVYAMHGSFGAGAPMPGVPEPMPVVGSTVGGGGALTGPPEPHLQSHGGQLCPGAHDGQPHAQVPLSTQPPPVPGSHLQSVGGQLSPGAQAGAAQVQVPPPEPPPEQSHSGGGQAAPAGQASGVTHAHGPPFGSEPWQKPLLEQSAPTGHRSPAVDQAQPVLALHAVASVIVRQGSTL
jgi:hypothetical protein